ncbi:MAG TPA: archaemetzincin [Planctomycetota bacterium]|nr:archaemetzincin [Planctomycetota bacterium]
MLCQRLYRFIPLVLVPLSCAAFSGESTAAEREKKINAVYASVAPEVDRNYERLGSPKSTDWRAHEQEEPQSLEDFMYCERAKITPERFTIVLQPLGRFDAAQRKLIQDLSEYAALFFQLPVRVAGDLDLEVLDKGLNLSRLVTAGRYTRKTKYDAERILDVVLKNLVPRDAAIYIAVTNVELDAEEQDVFGYASTTERAGLISFAGYYKASKGAADATTRRRAFKFLNHEVGHMLGLEHCQFYRCSMNGCNNLQQADETLHYCPVCQSKLKWALEYDPKKRDAALQEFYLAQGLSKILEAKARSK